MLSPIRLLAAPAIVLVAALSLACGGLRPAPRPAAHKPPRTVLLSTEADERRAGAEQTGLAIAELGLWRDEALQAYVQQVGERLVPHAPSARSFDYRFQVVSSWTPNAFALPGGSIFVSRGLVALTSSEDELANVLAHEIVHAAQRHAAAQQAFIRSSPFAVGLYGAMRVAAYTRDLEREADRGGQALAAAAGYDPAAMSAFLRKLDQTDRVELGGPRLQSFLETHPGLLEREAATFSRSETLGWTRKPGIAADRDAYLARLDGLVAGDDPAEGVFAGSRFLHPDLDFGVTFPEGWSYENTPRSVAAVSPSRNARFALEFAGKGDDPKLPAGAFLAEEGPMLGVQVLEARSLVINGRPAYQLRGVAPGPQGAITGLVTWIAHGGSVYRLSAATPSLSAGAYLGRARSLFQSFRGLSPAERGEIRIERVALARARDGENLADFFRRTGSGWDLARVGALNGLLPDARLREGDVLKIITSEPYVAAPATPAALRPSGPTGS